MTVSLTAETPVASTVHHPFGSPSGPGLFRMKGAQLPAYVQNVARAMLRSGSAHDESSAIQMAIGVIRRWAAGDAGKGRKTHPDVQAAAVKAIADWEALKARAHAHANGGDGVDFLELAVADAIAVPDPALRRQVAPPAERVPPGVREGGRYAPRPAVLTSHDTPEQAASVINGMGPRQRAAVRATTMPPPGFAWGANDRLAEAR